MGGCGAGARRGVSFLGVLGAVGDPHSSGSPGSPVETGCLGVWAGGVDGVDTVDWTWRGVSPVGSGFPGVKEWIQFGGDPADVPTAGGVTAVEAPLLYPYYPEQLIGLMGGLLSDQRRC